MEWKKTALRPTKKKYSELDFRICWYVLVVWMWVRVFFWLLYILLLSRFVTASFQAQQESHSTCIEACMIIAVRCQCIANESARERYGQKELSRAMLSNIDDKSRRRIKRAFSCLRLYFYLSPPLWHRGKCPTSFTLAARNVYRLQLQCCARWMCHCDAHQRRSDRSGRY